MDLGQFILQMMASGAMPGQQPTALPQAPPLPPPRPKGLGTDWGAGQSEVMVLPQIDGTMMLPGAKAIPPDTLRHYFSRGQYDSGIALPQGLPPRQQGPLTQEQLMELLSTMVQR